MGTTNTVGRLVVLDMAGTTVADGGLVEQAFTAAARHLGEDPASMVDHVRATMGESKISVFRHLFGDEARARAANAAFEKAYGELVGGGHIAPVPGAREAIDELRAQGRTVVLTTGFARVTQDAILSVLAAFLRTGAADGVQQIAVAGDTSYDMLSGVRAGAGVVAGVLTGAHNKQQLQTHGATHVLGSVAELPALLAGADR